MLLDILPELRGPRILCTTAGRGQLAIALATQDPACQVTCPMLEHHQLQLCTELAGRGHKNLQFQCTPDLPEGEFDVIAMPPHSKGEPS